MKPVLFNLGDFTVHSYFFFLTVGFIVATIIGIFEFKRRQLPIKDFIDLAIIIVIFGMIGARVMHIIAEDIPHDVYCSKKLDRCGPNPNKLIKEGGDDVIKEFNRGEKIIRFYIAHPSRMFNVFKGGLAYYGGFIFGTIAAVIFMKRRGMNLLFTSDTLGYGTAIGLFFGRMGCFLNGCCFGVPTDSFIGVRFPKGSAAFAEMANAGIVNRTKDTLTPAVLPTQIIESIFSLLLFLYLYLFLRKHKKYDGQVIIHFTSLYAIFRFIIEFFRNDNRGIFFGLLSSSQLVSIVMLLGSLWLANNLRKRRDSNVSKTV